MKLCPVCKNTYPEDYQTCPRDQSALTVLGAEIVPGMVLRGKYQVLRQLGAGGMATVYQVRHLAFHELAAIKVVHAQLMHDPGFIKRFRNEAVVARQLKHPNAVRVEDFDSTEDGRPFIVMEFVDGHSLHEVRRLAPGPWPISRCIGIISQAAEALRAAHALGIVHRDIKPANILLLGGTADQVHVKVLDFGIAKVAADAFAGMTSVLTEQGLLVGTPQYMSPEQASGSEAGIDARSDLYSLGLVLYEMLTGAPPFQADSPMSMLMHQINSVPAPPASICAVPPAISALVLKALHKTPADRFQSAADMLAALADPEAWYASVSPVAAAGPAASRVTTYPIPPPSDVHQPQPANPELKSAIARSAFPKKNWYVLASLLSIVVLAALVWAARSLLSSANRHQGPAANQQSIPRQSSSATTEPPPSATPPIVQRPAEKSTEPSRPTETIQGDTSGPQDNNLAAEPKAVISPTETPEAMYAKSLQLMKRKLPAEAVPLMKSACHQGNAPSCSDLGHMYEIGWVVREDKAQAIALYRKACDGGAAVGCTYLGNTYDIHNAQAVAFYRKACDGGDAWGCRNLGSRYDGGYGIAQNMAQAAVFYRKACDGSDMFGCDNLGRLYENGSGVPQDTAQAAAFYQKACDLDGNLAYLPPCEHLKKLSP